MRSKSRGRFGPVRVVPVPDVLENELLAETPAADRRCGDCTACCTVLVVEELAKPMRWSCDHQAWGGCRIYEVRPETCRQFNCLWLRGALPADQALRPDRLGVILDSFHRLGRQQL